MISLVVDSTCDLPIELIEKYNIKVLPLRVSINGTEYIDRVTITIKEVYDAMRMGKIPKTSQVNPADIYSLFEEFLKAKSDIIYLSFSSKLSGTYSLARNISEELKEVYPDRKLEIIDSKSGSAAIGLMALRIAKLIEKNITFEKIVSEAIEMTNHIEHIFSLTDLQWLVKGGRISKVVGTVGTMLNIKPILQVQDGEIRILKKVRGDKKIFGELLDIIRERINGCNDQIVAISHADDLQRALDVKEMLQHNLGINKFIITEIGCVLGTHLGIGGVGVLFFNCIVE